MSSSTFIQRLEQFEVREDVRRGEFVFTDGCGYVSSEIMEKVCKQF
jgi:hypothetical protein